MVLRNLPRRWRALPPVGSGFHPHDHGHFREPAIASLTALVEVQGELLFGPVVTRDVPHSVPWPEPLTARGPRRSRAGPAAALSHFGFFRNTKPGSVAISVTARLAVD